ncbi:MAG: GNAT family N-acetyltransferase [Parachlamydiaceae bacterium]|nr:GNAT family N-acetyltransferase [Parachlamydiaceae bacterium]
MIKTIGGTPYNSEIRMQKCTHYSEWEMAKKLRNTYFFDPLGLEDPYTWTFNHNDHVHLCLYHGVEMIGYAHIQLWPDHRAALRIFVINESHRKKGFGSQFLHLCERWLKTQGVQCLHDEARIDAVKFYRQNGYVEMPFQDPSGEPPSLEDVAMGKKL